MARRPAVLAVLLVLAVVAGAALAVDWFGGASGPTGATATDAGRTAPTAGSSASPTFVGAVSTARPTAAATKTPGVARPTATVPAIDPESGLRTIRRTALPKQALLTLDLIAVGGPFPYPEDGATYRNLEANLPARPTGYYREYTVDTPGSPDRGPRRIVAGRGGERYWTTDHHASFRRILP